MGRNLFLLLFVIKIGFVSTLFEALNISSATTTSTCGKPNVPLVGFYVSSLQFSNHVFSSLGIVGIGKSKYQPPAHR
jgi:hypothetical protein